MTPDIAFESGISSKGIGNDLLAHVSSNTTAGNFVSTSKKRDIAEAFAGKNGYVYKIQTDRGIDVNKVLGEKSPYPEQSEISIPGSIRSSEIVGAWKVREGKITEDFISNPNFRGKGR